MRNFVRKKICGEDAIKTFLKEKEIRPKGRSIKLRVRYAHNKPDGETWEYIFFVKKIGVLHIAKRELLKLIGYENDNDTLQGSRRATDNFYNRFTSVEDFLSLNEDTATIEEVETEVTDQIIDSEYPADNRLSALEEQLNNSPPNVETVIVNGRRIKRNQLVKRIVKERAGYQCQACSFTFIKRDGTKYVEAAHIDKLSASLRDTPDNMIALCPNCHKKLDYGNEEERNSILRVRKSLLF